MIPRNITRNHILKTLNDLQIAGIPKNRVSKKFLLEYKGKHFPPKYVISLANKYANGVELSPEEFSGGNESNTFLRSLGFKIIDISGREKIPIKKSFKTKKITPKKSPHNERCGKCKKTIQRMLETLYGEVKVNYRFSIGSKPDSFRNDPNYKSLKEIYQKLQEYRGHDNFVKSKTLPHCDYFIPNPGFVLEFDESQHFTQLREVALRTYPKKLRIGFDKDEWIRRCATLDKKDNDPPYRDEQRAWYDTLRDFCSSILGIPVVRLLPDETVWCELDPQSKNDVKWFKKFIKNKLPDEKKEKAKIKRGLGIGLVFPELGVHKIEYFLPLIEKYHKKFDLLVFPEGFETIKTTERITPEEVIGLRNVKELSEKYDKVCNDFNVSIILGFQIDYQNTAINGSGNDQYCLYLKPAGEINLYHKHSSSRFTAFFDKDWSLESSFLMEQVNGHNVGVSICHDMYISLIPRILKKRGAEIWINLSYQNVRSHAWEAVLQTRAVENSFIAACTLHRNSHATNAQKEPYGFSSKGKIILKDLAMDKAISFIPHDERAGKIYYFDINHFETYPTQPIIPTELPVKAQTLSVSMLYGERTSIKKDGEGYRIRKVDCEEFIFKPEILWKYSLEVKDITTFFIVIIKDKKQWEKYQNHISHIIRGRVIEFSTLFVFMEGNRNKVYMAAYRSSNYKDARIFFPRKFPIEIDKRYLKGMRSTYDISLNDPRADDEDIYFNRVTQMVDYLQ